MQQEDYLMDPEMQKQQFRILIPSLVCAALIPIIKLFDMHIPVWLALSLYLILTTVCIVNIFRLLRWKKRNGV
jgi:hypothetical protein